MDNRINNKITVEAQSALSTLKKLGNGYKTFGKQIDKSNSSMKKVYPTIKKTNSSFTNLTKDVNRSNKSLVGLTNTFSNLRRVMSMISFYALARGLANAISSAMDMIETANLFSVALGQVAVESNKALVEIQAITGLDLTNMQTAVGTFASLARSMGITGDQASKLSNNTYRLALDLASLYNVEISQALQDLRSGLVGQSETVYKYGIDVTEAALKTEALAQGIDKSVRNMSQGEKMALRYAVMIRQTSLAQGDFARTMDQPANQLRILHERFITLGRSIGNLFIPMLGAILPYLNAIVIALTRIINRLALLLGAEMPEIEDTSSALDNMGADTSDNIDDATASAKKLKGQLMGFDEINLWKEQEEPNAGGVGAIAGGTAGFELPEFDSGFDKIKQRAEELADSLETPLKRILDLVILIGSIMLGWKIANSVVSFLTNPMVGGGLLKTLGRIKEQLVGGQGINGLMLGWATTIGIIIWRFQDLVTESETFRKGLTRVKETFETIFKGLGILFSPVVDWIKKITKALWDMIPEDLKAELKRFFQEFEMDWTDLGITALGVALLFIPGGQIFGVLLLGFEALSLLIRGLGTVSEETWENIKTWFLNGMENVKTGFSDLWQDMKTRASQDIELIKGYFEKFGEIKDNFIARVVEIKNNWVTSWNEMKANFFGWIETVKTNFSEFWKGIRSTATENAKKYAQGWSSMWENLRDVGYDFANMILDIIENMVNGMIARINNMIEGFNRINEMLGSPLRIRTMPQINLPNLVNPANVPQKQQLEFASGGFPETGQMFIAREAGAELVGNIGGKSAVVNNDQIVEAVSSGVYQAVSSAMQLSSAGSDGSSPVVLNIDGKEFARMMLPKMDRESQRMGYKPILSR
jgi:hypothetical protein